MSSNKEPRSSGVGADLRVRLVRSLCAIAAEKSQSQQEVHVLSKGLRDARDRGLATELLYTSLRYAPAFLDELDDLLKAGVANTDPKLVWCLVVGLVQLRLLDRMPPHAAVGTAVDAARTLRGKSSSKVVNAVLRRVQRKMGDRPAPPPSERCYPAHILRAFGALRQGRENEAADAYLDRAPHVLRGMGTNYGDLEQLRSALGSLGVEEVQEGRVPGSILMPTGSVGALQDREKRWIPQDEASQAIGRLAGDLAKSVAAVPSVLDACAGRGVKTEQLRAILGSKATIVAADRAGKKLEQAKKLVNAEFFRGDLSQDLPGERLFDLVFVDAPCSGLGVLRRRPEIRLRRSEEDLQALSGIQKNLLANLSSAVRPGGILLYAVCTFSQPECQDRVDEFLGTEEGAEYEPLSLPAPPDPAWANPNGTWCTYDAPGRTHPADTFYAAAFRRRE